MKNKSSVDIVSIFLLLCIAVIGVASVYSATSEVGATLLEGRSGKQIMWMGVSVFFGIVIFLLHTDFFEVFSWYFYIGFMILLAAVLVVGVDINGARSWYRIGSFSLQPSEFAKYGTTFAVASVLSSIGFSFKKRVDLLKIASVILLPMFLIVLQGDAGSALVFGSFIIVFYREGLTPLVLILGILAIVVFVVTLVYGALSFSIVVGLLGVIFFAFTYSNKKLLLPTIFSLLLLISFSSSVQFMFEKGLQKHQQKRIEVMLNLIEDNKGAGYNVNQSKIAIGSGGLTGKGFLNGAHTKGNFIPEQETDFIFCTIGEEGGWLMSSLTIGLFVAFILRLYYLASRAKKKFKRIFIYSLASIIFFHLLVNVGMTIGLMPTIGIPLPLISYGGSSILAFSIFIFTALKMDATRDQDLKSIYS